MLHASCTLSDDSPWLQLVVIMVAVMVLCVVVLLLLRRLLRGSGDDDQVLVVDGVLLEECEEAVHRAVPVKVDDIVGVGLEQLDGGEALDGETDAGR